MITVLNLPFKNEKVELKEKQSSNHNGEGRCLFELAFYFNHGQSDVSGKPTNKTEVSVCLLFSCSCY